MTEEQRMEEGRRMFQIFAARMFEQRVLTAYREKVAAERQKKLLDELEQEGQLDAQREAKKAREAAKKKEKKRLQKQAKDEERAKKDAEKAAQEAAVREVEAKKLEEQRQRKEEQRKKREAERKAAEDERQRKEAEKQRRAQEERERQAEAERKQREAKGREKKKREEAKNKDRIEREAKEKEVRELKSKQDEERKAKEGIDRKEKDTAQKAGKETIKRQPIALPPGLLPPAQSNNVQSPLLPIATPMVPVKAPTPGRPRQTSHQGQQSSYASSPRSQQAMTETSHSSASPASIAVPQTPSFGNVPIKSQSQTPMLHHPQPSAPLSPLNQQNRNGHLPFGMNGLPGLGLNGPGVSGPGVMPNVSHMQNFGPPMPGQQRFGPPQGMPYPPGFNAPRQYGPAQQMPFHSQASMPPPISAPHHQQSKGPSHSRQQSGSQQETTSQPAPIGGNRPGPVGRPSSTTPDKQPRQVSGSKALLGDSDMDDPATHLGSKALLDDGADATFVPSHGGASKVNIPLGPPGSGRATFSSSFGDGKFDTMGIVGPNWGGFSPSAPNASSWGAPGPNARNSGGWNQQASNAFGSIGGMHGMAPRPNASRPFAIRNLLAQACRQLSASPGADGDGFVPASNVLRQVDAMKATGDPQVSMDEMLTYCETEGNAQNGGGSFEVRGDGPRGMVVKFSADSLAGRNSVGDIGSPVVSHGMMAGVGGFGAPGRGF
jgi:actin-related protein